VLLKAEVVGVNHCDWTMPHEMQDIQSNTHGSHAEKTNKPQCCICSVLCADLLCAGDRLAAAEWNVHT
jgi:hypothetical protein